MLRQGCDIAPNHHWIYADLRCFAEFHGACPNARCAADQLFYLASYPAYGHEEVDRTITVLRSFFGAT